MVIITISIHVCLIQKVDHATVGGDTAMGGRDVPPVPGNPPGGGVSVPGIPGGVEGALALALLVP
jgi:hypothetical protein